MLQIESNDDDNLEDVFRRSCTEVHIEGSETVSAERIAHHKAIYRLSEYSNPVFLNSFSRWTLWAHSPTSPNLQSDDQTLCVRLVSDWTV
jgi:hypothetical protein